MEHNLTGTKLLHEMLRYKRPQDSVTQRIFCERFLEPVMGKPDLHGNYIHHVGDNNRIAFMAHHDTVHNEQGIQEVIEVDGFFISGSNCLGADCTTGVWLILEMIAENVPGTYVVHAAEEIGCVGSQALVNYHPKWLDDIDAAISFDRFGRTSIITHQMGLRTASDAFSESLANVLGMDMRADDGGSYTDSNEYSDIVSECTNISVGYYSQHTSREVQDINFAVELRDALVTAKWSELETFRDPQAYDFNWAGEYYGYGSSSGYDANGYIPRGNFRSRFDQSIDADNQDMRDLYDLVVDNPEVAAALLIEMGYSPYDFQDEVGRYFPDRLHCIS